MHCSCERFTVGKDRLSSGNRKEGVIGMSRRSSNVYTVLSVKETFLSVDEWWFQTHVTDALKSVSECYVGQVQNEGHIYLILVPTEKGEACGHVDQGRVAL